MAYRRPYLNLKERLSQVWFNYYTIFVLLLILKIVLFRISLNHSISEAETETYSLCDSAEKYASYIASMPHYMSKYTNIIIAKGLQEAHQAMIEALLLTMTASKNMIIFAINLTIGTYVCLLTAAVDVSVDVALNATESVIHVANETMISFADDLDDGLGEVSTAANKVLSAIGNAVNSVEDFFGGGDDGNDLTNQIGKVNLTIKSIRDWEIPGNINSKIQDLRNQVPDFDDVQNKTNMLISIPFDEVNKKMNESLSSGKFEATDLYVPDTKNVTFCRSSNDIEDFYKETSRIIYRTSIIIVSCLILVMLAMIIYESWCSYRNWKRIERAAGEVVQVQVQDQSLQRSIAVIDSFQNRASTMISSIICRMWRQDRENDKNRLKWMINYSISPYALPILLLGILGLLGVALQSIILDAASHVRTEDLEVFIEDTGKQVVSGINGSVIDWCNHTNEYIDNYQVEINEGLLGWVANTTSAVNDTVNEFMDGMNTELKDVFGDTPLYDPIQGVVGCMITRKLESIEKALTWVHDKADISLPTMNSTEFLDDVWSDDGTGDGKVEDRLISLKDDMTEMLKRIVEDYRKSLQVELWIALGLIGLWVGILILGGVILSIGELARRKKDASLQVPAVRGPSLRSFEEINYFGGKGVINQALSKILSGMRARDRDESFKMRDTDSALSELGSDEYTDSFSDPGLERARRWGS